MTAIPAQPQHTAKRSDSVPVRVPAVDPRLMAHYWREALEFFDMSAIAANGESEKTPNLCIELDAVENRAALRRTEQDDDKEYNGTDVQVVLQLWELDNRAKRKEQGKRRPLLAVPATLVDDEFLAPRTNEAPILNAKYLSPNLDASCLCLGENSEANGYLFEAFNSMTNDKTVSPGWATWWNTFVSVILTLLKVDNIAEAEKILAHRANDVIKDKPVQWKLYAAVYPADKSGTKVLSDVYLSIAELLPTYQEDTALYQRLCGTAGNEPLAQLTSQRDVSVLGHIDEYNEGGRELFPLDPTQRNAVRSILNLANGELQAVHGPPGSGKTSMLRAVVASRWVNSALKQEACPIIIACGATNQSVTNVIGAFGNAPHPDDSIPYAKRWIPDAPSYGAFLPAESVLSNEKKQPELTKFVCLKSTRNGFLYEYVNRNNVLNPAGAIDYEHIYLEHARGTFANSNIVTMEDAVQQVWERLSATDIARYHFANDLLMNSDRALTAGEQYLATDATHWATARQSIARQLLDELRQDSNNIQAAEKFMDLCWRAESFHWAARYWEGRFLLAQRELLFSQHPKNVEETLRRLCMLTPCLVSTLHSAPRFAKIDSSTTTEADQRTHYFGLFDLLVVDEAGQASPELAGAVFSLAKTAAVVGDLQQLAPIWNHTRLTETAIAKRVNAEEALESIIRSGRSVASGSTLGIARLVSRWTEPDIDGVLLRFHYRCKPSIIAYCNQLSYNNSLNCQTDEKESFPEPALAWVDVVAEPKQIGGSYLNQKEANEIVEWIVERWTSWREDPKFIGKPIQDIVAIITPYRYQSDYLSAQMAKAFTEARKKAQSDQSDTWPTAENIEKVTIGTVHRLQGAERPIVCFSLVEGPDQAAGSFIDRDATLLNVAVSRAKRSFIIFANPKRLFSINKPVQGVTLSPTGQLGEHLRRREEARRLYPTQLVLIEAVGKSKTIAKILGKRALVQATKGALWKLSLQKGVDVNAGFVPRPKLELHASQILEKVTSEIASVDSVVLATDDDRMGEYISWQALQLLSASLKDKLVERVRIGTITRSVVLRAFEKTTILNERIILAEVVREVVDCLVSQRFAQALNTSSPPQIGADELNRLVEIGACTNSTIAKQQEVVGRVQAAVLRLMLARARAVDGASNQRRIMATIHLGEKTLNGIVYREEDYREVTEAESVNTAVNRLQGLSLGAASMPEIRNTSISAPSASTINMLTSAWVRYGITPWETMASLQSLYDGTWSDQSNLDFEPIDPIEPSSVGAGHPPITPLDRTAIPEQMQSVMTEQDHKIYSLIWDYFANATQSVNLLEMSVSYAIGDSTTLRIRFDGVSCEECAPEMERDILGYQSATQRQSAIVLRAHWSELRGSEPTFKSIPAQVWDLTMDQLLSAMNDLGLGRPSTIANSLQGLYDKGLIELPIDRRDPLKLTRAGFDTAITLEAVEGELSSPSFTKKLNCQLANIERGDIGPREVLTALTPIIAPDFNVSVIRPKIWNSLEELEAAMTQQDQRRYGGSLITWMDDVSKNDSESEP